jgi:hypothetical protein
MKLLRVAAVAALVGLGFTIWSVVDPRPLALLVGGLLGAVVGGLSFLLFVVTVVADLRRAHVLDSLPPPPPGGA